MHTEEQHTPSTQKPLEHSAPCVHAAPLASRLHEVLPLHVAAPGHSLSGSCPTRMLPQVPSEP